MVYSLVFELISKLERGKLTTGMIQSTLLRMLLLLCIVHEDNVDYCRYSVDYLRINQINQSSLFEIVTTFANYVLLDHGFDVNATYDEVCPTYYNEYLASAKHFTKCNESTT